MRWLPNSRDLFELLYRVADRETAKRLLIERWQVSDPPAEGMLAARLDGDTVDVRLVDGRERRMRLIGIDIQAAPG